MHRTLCFVALAAWLAAGVPGSALAADWGFKMWAATTYVAPLSESNQNISGVTATVKASDEMGYQFGAEFRSGAIGLAFDYLHARQDLEQTNAGLLGSADFNPISATLYLHLPMPILELYAGPTVSYVNWGELDLKAGGSQKLDAKLGYGVSVGADLALKKALALTGGVRWLKLEAEPKGIKPIAVDPLVSHVGLALRF